jgi:hypothetical protein
MRNLLKNFAQFRNLGQNWTCHVDHTFASVLVIFSTKGLQTCAPRHRPQAARDPGINDPSDAMRIVYGLFCLHNNARNSLGKENRLDDGIEKAAAARGYYLMLVNPAHCMCFFEDCTVCPFPWCQIWKWHRDCTCRRMADTRLYWHRQVPGRRRYS